jgi:hypothetical protein
MRKMILLTLVALVATVVVAPSSDAAVWPAKCKKMKCVNDRRNRLHRANLNLRARVRELEGQVEQLQRQVNCYSPVAFARYHGTASGVLGAPYTTPDPSDYGPAFDGYLDRVHVGQPDNTYVYRIVTNTC